MERTLQSDLQHFYDLLARLAEQSSQGRQLAELTGKLGWPRRGVYFFRETGELRTASPATQRVVRVGTHAVSANSKSTLWGRLRTHRGSRTGSGNHRGSIFRLHVGAALLARDRCDHATWGVGSSAPKRTRLQETELEQRVSATIGAMTVLWVEVPDEPSTDSARAIIERNSIALLSGKFAPLDSPSAHWLGRASPREPICRSGLWNLNYVADSYDPRFLDILESYVVPTGTRSARAI